MGSASCGRTRRRQLCPCLPSGGSTGVPARLAHDGMPCSFGGIEPARRSADDELPAHLAAAFVGCQVAVEDEPPGAVGAELECHAPARRRALGDPVLVNREAGGMSSATSVIFTRSPLLTSMRSGLNAYRRAVIVISRTVDQDAGQ